MPKLTKEPNPFYLLLLAVSVAFALTTFGYLIGPSIAQRALDNPGAVVKPGTRAMATWLDKHGPTALGVEFGLMLAAGVGAMLTDGWFERRRAGRRSTGP